VEKSLYFRFREVSCNCRAESKVSRNLTELTQGGVAGPTSYGSAQQKAASHKQSGVPRLRGKLHRYFGGFETFLQAILHRKNYFVPYNVENIAISLLQVEAAILDRTSMSRMNSESPTMATKNVRCGQCNKSFSRTDHLKRHQLRRKSGSVPVRSSVNSALTRHQIQGSNHTPASSVEMRLREGSRVN
jgi:hypothetical protein